MMKQTAWRKWRIAFPVGGQNSRARRSWRQLGGSEAGMATAEYAIASVAAVAFAGLLVLILRSGESAACSRAWWNWR